MSPRLRLVPLGGLGEFGMNCMALEQGNDLLLVDCGVMFPFRVPGVDVIHPDFAWVLERRDRLRAVVATHGHEDHIGGIPHLLRHVRVPVYGPPHALELLRARLEEDGGRSKADLRPTRPGKPFEVGSFGVEPVRVTHSIPDATALLISTAVGTVLHTGDFNIDEEPLDAQPFDADRFAEAGRAGVRLLLSDSTNVDVPGDSGQERTVATAIDRIVESAPARVVLCTFASNLHRLGAIFDVARAHDRKLLLLGRSLRTHVRAGTAGSILRDPCAHLVPDERAQAFARERLLVVATGTQAEAPSAMARLAAGTHPSLSLEAGDTVVFSSRIIPGHEQSVFAMINALLRRGIRVIHRAVDPEVHVSGHAARDEQRRMLELVRPQTFVPVHGTYHHLTRHAELAHEMGVPEVLVVEDGAIVEVGREHTRVIGQARVGRVHVEGGEPIHEDVLRERSLLGELGVAVVVVQLDRAGKPVAAPQILMQGVVHEEQEDEVVAGAREFVESALRDDRSLRLEPEAREIEERARRALRRYLVRTLGRKPLTHAVVVQLP